MRLMAPFGRRRFDPRLARQGLDSLLEPQSGMRSVLCGRAPQYGLM
jgi:hypothetical protein